MSFLARQLVKNIINSVGAMMPPRPSMQFIGLSPSAITDSPSLNATVIDLSAIAGGGITQLTGDVLAGAGSGSQSATVTRINGATVPAGGALAIGAALLVSAASALSYGPLNLSLSGTAVTGTLSAAHGGLPSGGSNGEVVTLAGGAPTWAAIPPATNLNLTGQAEGDIAYFDGTSWVVLAPGTSGYFLQTQGAGAIPQWAATSGGGFTAGGDLSGSSTSQEVIGLLSNALPSLTTGYLNWTGSAWALSAVSGGGYTSTTGDVLSSGSGAVATTVAAISGTSPIAVTPNALQWVAGATGPLLTQANSSGAGAPFTIAPQASTGAASGSFVVTLAAPGGGTTEAKFEVNRTSGASLAFYSDAPGDAFLTMNGGIAMQVQAGRSGMYLGGGVTSSLYLFPGSVVTGAFFANGNVQLLPGSAGDFGGGSYVLGLNACYTAPTTAVSTPGDIVLYGEAVSTQSYLGILASGIFFNGAAAHSGNFLIAPLPSSSGGTNLLLQSGAPGSGSPGTVALIADDLSATALVTRSSIILAAGAGSTISIDATSAVSVGINIGTTTTGAVAIGNTGASSASLSGSNVTIASGTGPINFNAGNGFTYTGPTTSLGGATPTYIPIVVNGVLMTITALHS